MTTKKMELALLPCGGMSVAWKEEFGGSLAAGELQKVRHRNVLTFSCVIDPGPATREKKSTYYRWDVQSKPTP